MTTAGELRVRIGSVPATLRGDESRLVLQFAGLLDTIRAAPALLAARKHARFLRVLGLTPALRIGPADFAGLPPRLAR